MNSNNNLSNNLSNLSLIHPDDTFEQPITPVSNMSLDGGFNLRNSDYISSAMDSGNETDDLFSEREKMEDCFIFEEENKNLYPINPPLSHESVEIIDKILLEDLGIQMYNKNKSVFIDKIGDGKMEYITDKSDREMFTNGWKAITFTNNWDFLAEHTDSFAFSNDPRIHQITKKMEEFGYNGHSGASFSLTMRSMQYLLHYGEEEFKKMF